MQTNYSKVLSDLVSILDIDCDEKNFYDFMLLKLREVSSCNFLGVFFITGRDFRQKAFLKDAKTSLFPIEIAKEIFEDFNKNDEKTFHKKIKGKHFLISKLLVKNSPFGFVAINFDFKPEGDLTCVVNAYISAFSYLIKDFELTDVFKTQVTALSNAIKDRNDAYQIIERQNKRLVKLDEHKNQFMLNMSHDLRTPLNSIIGFSEALESQIFGELNAKQKEYITDIQTSSLCLLNTLNEILNFSKIKARIKNLNLSEFSPKLMILEVIRILNPLNKQKNIDVTFKNDYEGTLFADCQKFQQLLYNLLTNAIKYTNENGKIEIRAFLDENKFILEVEDNGIGIEKKNLNKIFKKFVRLNENSNCESSTGLGLTIAKEIVKQHKGNIFVSSEPNKGSIFKVVFDIHQTY